jgi:phage terminase large subunit-like protein
MLLADRVDADKTYADKGALWWKTFETEAVAFPSSGHDDQIDAVSTGLEAFQQMKSWRAA